MESHSTRGLLHRMNRGDQKQGWQTGVVFTKKISMRVGAIEEDPRAPLVFMGPGETSRKW